MSDDTETKPGFNHESTLLSHFCSRHECPEEQPCNTTNETFREEEDLESDTQAQHADLEIKHEPLENS